MEMAAMQGHKHKRILRRRWWYMNYLVALVMLSVCWYSMQSSEWHPRMIFSCRANYHRSEEASISHEAHATDLQRDLKLPRRTDVLMLTPWLAPIVWNETYNLAVLNAQFHQMNVCVGITIFAIKKYTVFVPTFIETAEKYFMMGHKVNYYIFTDRVSDIPIMELAEGRRMQVLRVPAYQRWQDVSMRRMEMLRDYSHQQFRGEVDYLVCVDVDMRFSDEVGVESLSDLFGTLHPGMYGATRKDYTYERNLLSEAYISFDEGDFYYAGGYFGGNIEEIYKLTNFCHNAMMNDKDKNIEAVWHDESYLNKYFLYHKPTKVLSPEYLWDDGFGTPAFLRRKRFLAVRKNHHDIRN
ncbi:histo-blood group ABO system transferase-like isoform X2 [Dendrobates tinctorius]|uniref:histo-blood group ABO system transferase-like isoform X2 n=1 Tax=Dendrobates tinctorius TaxID=92724 RepID=UPI003CC95966